MSYPSTRIDQEIRGFVQKKNHPDQPTKFCLRGQKTLGAEEACPGASSISSCALQLACLQSATALHVKCDSMYRAQARHG